MLKEWREIITYIKNKHIYKQGADAHFITDVCSFKHAASTHSDFNSVKVPLNRYKINCST